MQLVSPLGDKRDDGDKVWRKDNKRTGEEWMGNKKQQAPQSGNKKLKLICNLKSCWNISIMGCLPTNKLLSGSKWDQASPGPAGGLDQWPQIEQIQRKRQNPGIWTGWQKQHSKASMFSGTGNTYTRYKWNNLVYKRIMSSCWKWNKARSRWNLIPLGWQTGWLVHQISTY